MTTEDVADAIAGLQREVEQLRDLFRRRLLEDQDKRRLYDELYAQLQWCRTGLTGEFLAPLARELLLLVDRLEESDHSAEYSAIVNEVLEPLYRRGLTDVNTEGPFDAAIHEVAETVAPDEGTPAGHVVGVYRRGFLLGDRLLRPARVVISAETASLQEASG